VRNKELLLIQIFVTIYFMQTLTVY